MYKELSQVAEAANFFELIKKKTIITMREKKQGVYIENLYAWCWQWVERYI